MSTTPDDNKPEILKYVDEIVKRENKKILEHKKIEKKLEQKKSILNSYGAAVLDNNMIVNVKHNFYFLEQLWIQWIYAKEFEMTKELDVLKTATNGGLFDAGDLVFKIDSIKMLIKPEPYYNSSREEKEGIDLKNAMINSYVADSFFSENGLFYSEEEDDEE